MTDYQDILRELAKSINGTIANYQEEINRIEKERYALLEACVSATELLAVNGYPDLEAIHNTLRAAIAKAIGEA